MSEEAVAAPTEELRRRWPLVNRAHLVERACAQLVERTVIISGFAGVGKTALSRLVESRLRSEGWSVERAVATPAGRDVPFSAFAGLGDGIDVGSTAEQLATSLRQGPDVGPPVLVVVDDAQWLDASSLAVVAGAVNSGEARILLTVRTGEPGADGWLAMADDGLIDRIELGAAERDLIASIVDTALGGSPTSTLIDELSSASAGNLLFLRELVLAGVEAGAVSTSGKRIQLVQPLPRSGTLGRTIARRMRSLDDDERDALAAIAIVEPAPVDMLSQFPWGDPIPGLERRGFVVTEADGTIRMAHPLLGEAASAALTGGEFRRQLDRVTDDVLAKLPAHDSDLALRLVSRRVAFDLFVPIGWVRSAAGRAFALLDHELAVKLGARALDTDPLDVEANLVVGAGLSAQFLTDDADAYLRSALEHARTDSQRARSAGRLGLHLGTRLGRRAEALELMRTQLAIISEPTWREFLAADIGKIELLAGDRVTTSPPMTDDDPLATLNRAIMTALVASLAGDVREAEEAVARGMPLASRHIGVLPNARDLLRLAEFVTRLAAGDASHAEAIATDELDACRAGRDEPAGMWRAMLATSALATGQPAAAEEQASLALPLVAERDFVGGLFPSTQATRAVALAQLGRFDECRHQLGAIEEVWHSDPRTDASSRQALAWCAALEARADGGGELASAAEIAASAGMTSVALQIGYDAVRLGAAGAVVDLLVAAAHTAPATIAPLYARHARAVAAADVSAMPDIAAEFDRRSLPVLAAEVRLGLAAITDDAARARWLGAEAASQMRAAGLSSSPFVELQPPSAPAGTLTDRQMQIARMAADRLRSKEIAAALGVSVRTVDNLLGQVYRMLGVSSRDGLRGALGVGAVRPIVDGE